MRKEVTVDGRNLYSEEIHVLLTKYYVVDEVG
jgi:hypothetical protein